MKSSTLLIAIMVGFLTSSLCAQETVWFDSNWKVSIKEKAAYYRPSPKKRTKVIGLWTIMFLEKNKWKDLARYLFLTRKCFKVR